MAETVRDKTNDIMPDLPMYNEDDLLPLSALQHLLFCDRQCALIHIEQIWVENLYTAEGRIMHERVDSGRSETRGDVRLSFSLPLRSLRLGLSGKADVVEFHREQYENGEKRSDAVIWLPFPVEHKRGRPKKELWDKVQLCAQAICLEEMLSVSIPAGYLYYGETRHRVEVELNNALRKLVQEMSNEMHAYFSRGYTPRVRTSKACRSCSLADICLPVLQDKTIPASEYIRQQIEAA